MFKIGDKVRVINEMGNALKGYNGIIRALPGKNGARENGGYKKAYSVEFPAWKGGHFCGGTVPSGHGFWIYSKDLELIKPNPEKIVITHDGKTTLARLYDGKTVVKSAEVKCDPRDEFDFAAGAKLAFKRLTGEEKEEPPKFDKSMLTNGRFGCASDGDWFVVVNDMLVFRSGTYDDLERMNSEGEHSTYSVKFVCEALSFDNAKRNPKVIWKAPDFELKKVTNNA